MIYSTCDFTSIYSTCDFFYCRIDVDFLYIQYLCFLDCHVDVVVDNVQRRELVNVYGV